MKCLFGLVLEDWEWILCLDISLGCDQLKDAVEDIGKSAKLWRNSLIYLRSVFFCIEGEKEGKFPLTDWIKSLKKNLMTLAVIRDWDSLLDSDYCALNLNNKFQAMRFKYPFSHLLVPCPMHWSHWHEPNCCQSKWTKGDSLVYTEMHVLALNWRGFTTYE